MPKIKYKDFNFRPNTLAVIDKANEIIADGLFRLAGVDRLGMSGADRLQVPPSFRGDAKHRTRNLEIPGLRFAHPGMTARRGYRTTPEMNPA